MLKGNPALGILSLYLSFERWIKSFEWWIHPEDFPECHPRPCMGKPASIVHVPLAPSPSRAHHPALKAKGDSLAPENASKL